MAQPSSKFVSVNLNKSYGQPSSRSSSALGNGRPRSASSVVGSKVSIPPPVNLPSLRKEHERFNPSSATGATSRLGGSGTGSSTMGWTKPAVPSLLQDRGKDGGTPTAGSVDRRAGSPYLPSTGKPMPPERAVLLRGEDFPSLRATVTKQKDDVGQKQKQKQKQKPPEEEEVTPEVQSPLDMRPHLRSSRLVISGVPEKNEVSSRQLGIAVPSQNPDGHFLGLFPIVPLSRTSDWADDERDTGLSIPERGFSRPSSARDDGSREFSKGDSFGRDISGNVKDGRDVSSWRSPPQARDGISFRDFGVDGDRMGAKASPPSRQMSKESNNGQLSYIDSARNRYSNGAAQDTPYSRRDLGYGYNNQNGRNVESPINKRVVDQNTRGRFSDLLTNRFGGDSFQNRLMSKSPFSSGDKGLSFSDPILNFGREKRPIPNSGKQYTEDAGLDSTDPFAGAPIGEVNIKVFKKKDTLKQVDFYDPVRESFEAELERVQRVQELERQRAIEEQDRALELARREQEERERLVREEEERRRRYEEQAREAAWIAEQEKLEAAKRIEEQKNAREDEKRRIFTEEERRKESARKKLLELEERIAKRKAEASLKDTRLPSAVGETSGSENIRDVPRVSDVGEWEDGERMVESITNTAAPDVNKFFDAVSRPHSSRGQNSSFMDSGKHASNWRRDAYGNKNSSMFFLQDENDHHISRRDAFSSGRGLTRKEIRGNIGPVVRPSSRGTSESSQVMDDLRHARGNKWNNDGDVDYLNRNSDIDAEFLDNDKFGDITWGPGRSRAHAPYTERSYQNYEVDGFLPFGRSRHSLRQPRVLPPPSISSVPKISTGPSTVHPSSLSYLESELRYQHVRKPDEGSYDRVYNERIQQPGITGSLAENTVSSEKIVDKNILRCDSQSSLSVSSPPASPTHLSHDDLDESEASQLLPTSVIEEQAALSDNEHVMSASEVVDTNIIATSSSDSHGEDDEWAAESHELTQLQEVYDEDDDGYQEEEEAHEGTGENLDTRKEFDDMRSDVLDTTGEVDQVILGFDEGVEVRIPITDEFEKTCRSSKLTVGVPGGSSQELVHSGIGLDTENDFLEGTVNESSSIINETEKAVQELVKDSVSTTSYLSDNVNASGNLGASVQHAGSTGLSSMMPSTSTVQPIQPSVSTVPSQSEVPIKLQFGLFSGLPLIPSPVPAIQFGSIQMPLHPHPQVGPSIAQVHPSRPSFFQFGQLRCPPISQGIFALPPQSMSFVQRPPPRHNFINQNQNQNQSQSHEGMENNQASPESSSLNNSGDEMVSASVPMDKLVMKPVGPAQDTMEGRQINSLTDHQSNEAASQVQTGSPSFGGIKSRYGSTSASQFERHGIHDVMVKRNYRPVSIREPLLHPERSSSQFIFGEKASGGGSKDPGMVSGSRGKKFHYRARNVRPRTFFPGPEISQHTDSSGFQRRSRRNIQRTEFRVREAFDRRQNDYDRKLNYNLNASGNSAKYGGKKDVVPGNSKRLTIESQDVNPSDPSSRAMISDAKLDRVSGKVVSSKQRMAFVDNSYAGNRNLRRNGSSEEYDDDAPLQCGVVRVFKQSGIEVPSDEDDFIQVRSKRQMLNDRREQREKEIKAKSRGAKIPRKNRAVPQRNADTYIPDKVVPPFVADAFNNIRSSPNITDKDEAHLFVAKVSSQSLLPVVTLTPVVNVDLEKDSESLKSSHGRPVPAISNHPTNFVPGLSFENKRVAFDNASMPLGSWVNADLNQQVMALTQSELDESMQSTLFDSHAASSISHEPNKLPTSITTHGKTFAPSASPLNSLLAGEKIQFGAVTYPTILPPVNQTVSSEIGPPDSGMAPKLPTSENDYTVFIDQEKCPNEPCTHVEDPEAEAAASAVAAAVISNNNEIVGNRSSTSSVPVSDTKKFSVPDATISTSGGHVTTSVTGQSTPPEKSLTISLPADLSVDSSSLPLWQPLSSPQSSSGAMLSHLPSHIPFFEMNPIVGGPLFAFGPHDEPAGSHAQAQRSAPFHPAMESFYGPPAGFAGPFISPGGVQCPPHMLVYNHYTPVGQYGQVGLSFMGTTFIPSAKQPDWKHSPVSPMVGVGEIDIDNLNTVSGQRNSPRIPAPIQHLAPGSPLMPLASPLTMFDMTPFQSSADLSLQTRWSHLPAPPIHSVPFSHPLQQQQQDGMLPHMFTGVLPVPVDTSTGNNQFKEPRFSIAADGNNQFSLNSRTDGVQRHGSYCGPSSLNDTNEVLKNPKSSASTVANSSESGGVIVGQSLKPQAPQQAASSGQQYLHPIGYSDQRGDGASQKSGSGGEWHRRTGYHRKSQISGSDKSVASSKMKQIYVAKSQTGGSAATG